MYRKVEKSRQIVGSGKLNRGKSIEMGGGGKHAVQLIYFLFIAP